MSEEADRAAAAKWADVVEAALNGDLPAVRGFVRQNRAAALSATNQKFGGITALMCAATRDHDDVVHFLIEAKADLDIANNDGRTALRWAARCGCLRSAGLLVAAGASLDVKDGDGETPLDDARSQGHDNVVKLLESAAQKKVEAATGGYAAEAKPSAAPIAAKEAPVADAAPTTPKAKPSAAPIAAKEPPADAAPTTPKAFDIRQKKWFNPWEQKVFSQMQACFDDVASGVVVIGVKPGRERAMTLWEWPALQEDLRHAYDKQAYPFFEKGKEVIPWDSLRFMDVRIDELSDELEHQTKKDKSVIVASCCTDHMDEVKECVRKHNQSQKQGHGKAFRCYGTAEDFQT